MNPGKVLEELGAWICVGVIVYAIIEIILITVN